jgi:hypothetical protein
MSETLTAPEEITRRTQDIVVQGTQLNNSMWGIEETAPIEKKAEVVEKAPETTIVETKNDGEEILEPNEWLKREFNFESAEAAKNEIAELRKLKENPVIQDYKFENEESKKLAEAIAKGDRKAVLKILETQDRLETYASTEVTDDTAADIIKLNMQLKYADLSASEIEYKYNKEFGIPKEPSQLDTETDDEFEDRKSAWQEKVIDIKTNRNIEAKLAKPNLEQLRSKIVLPDIQPQQQQKQLSQEELDAAKKFDEAYLSSVNDSLKNFNGFSVKVKNEAVGLSEISIPYVAIDSEKGSLTQELTDFAKNGYNSNTLFASEWVNEDGSINTKRIAEDRYLLKNRDRILQKVAEEAATKGVEAYIKGKKNIDLSKQNQPGTAVITKEDKTEFDIVRDSFFG